MRNFVSHKLPLSCCALLFCLFACSQRPELLQNNDPSKYQVHNDIVWASPDEFDLTMDIYTPNTGKAPYPVIVVFHGGGWLINDKSIMDQLSKYLVTNGKYVVCNVDYRLLSDNDNTVTLNEIVEDAFGAVLWVKDHISRYQGDAAKIAVTGDSAGGHLSAMIVNMGDQLRSTGFAGQSLGFNPTYLPAGKSAEQVAQAEGLDVQAAILSYGAYDVYQAGLGGFEGLSNPFWLMSGSIARGVFGAEYNAADNPDMYRALSPIHNIPSSSQRQLPPQLLTVGSDDELVTPASVREYTGKLQAAGHSAQFWEHAGRPHAFLDSGSNRMIGISFEDDAPPALDVMLSFLDGVFYP